MPAPALLFGACVTSDFLEPGNCGGKGMGRAKEMEKRETTAEEIGRSCFIRKRKIPETMTTGTTVVKETEKKVGDVKT